MKVSLSNQQIKDQLIPRISLKCDSENIKLYVSEIESLCEL